MGKGSGPKTSGSENSKISMKKKLGVQGTDFGAHTYIHRVKNKKNAAFSHPYVARSLDCQ